MDVTPFASSSMNSSGVSGVSSEPREKEKSILPYSPVASSAQPEISESTSKHSEVLAERLNEEEMALNSPPHAKDASADLQPSSGDLGVSPLGERDTVVELSSDEDVPKPSSGVKFSKTKMVRQISPNPGMEADGDEEENNDPPARSASKRAVYELRKSSSSRNRERGIGLYVRIPESEFLPGSATKLVMYFGENYTGEIPTAVKLYESEPHS
ncbi:hypothetical protein RUND412_003358 [Rhizina undulata]